MLRAIWHSVLPSDGLTKGNVSVVARQVRSSAARQFLALFYPGHEAGADKARGSRRGIVALVHGVQRLRSLQGSGDSGSSKSSVRQYRCDLCDRCPILGFRSVRVFAFCFERVCMVSTLL